MTKESQIRSITWMITSFCCLPLVILLVGLLHYGIAWLERVTNIDVPTWLQNLLGLLMYGLVYVGTAYLVARRLDRRFPNSKPRLIPDPSAYQNRGPYGH